MAGHSHKRETTFRKKPVAIVVAASLAVLATGTAVATGVAVQEPNDATTSVALDARSAPEPADNTDTTDDTLDAAADAAVDVKERQRAVTRSSGGRGAVADAGALAGAKTQARTNTESAVKRWTTEALNLWTAPDEGAEQVGEIEAAEVVHYTGRSVAERDEVVVDGDALWVTSGYLAKEKPEITESGTDGECTNGTSVASGVSSHVVDIHEAVCARWPDDVSTYGTLRADSGDHGTGNAVDIMITGETGWEIAEYVRENASAFGVSYIIYEQQIWSVERSGEGWRGMEDRGSATANHFDHVHVSVY